MKLMLIVSALALLAPVAPRAQTTHCQSSIYGMPELGVTCRTTKPAMPRDTTLDTTGCPLLQQISESCDLWAQNRRAGKRKQIATLIVEGRCEDAFKAAIVEGDFAFAREVRELCAPAAPVAPATRSPSPQN